VVIRIVDEAQRARLAFAATQEMPSMPPTERASSDEPPAPDGSTGGSED
jgi:hypothetical protein